MTESKIDWTEHGQCWAATGWIDKGCLSPKEIWAKWGSRINCVNGGHEFGTTETPEHWQMCIQMKKVTYRRAMHMIFPLGLNYCKPQYKADSPAKQFKCQQVYCEKEGIEYQSFGEYKMSKQELAHESKRASHRLVDDIKDGMDYHDAWDEHPYTMMHSYRAAMEAVRMFHPEITHGFYELKDFNREPITDWSKSIVLHGAAGIGKTQYALAHFKSALMVSNRQDLGKFNKKKHDGIVFDDMSFNGNEEWTREEQLHLVENELPKTFNIKFGHATIPGGTKKIFTTNMQNIFIIGDAAIDRRMRWIMNLTDLRISTN